MTAVTLYRRELVKEGACSTGMALFDCMRDLQGRRHSVRVKDWSPLHTVWLATAEPSFRYWLAKRNLIPFANLSGEDLSGADLRNADLSDADLSGADLRNADLSDADLSDADLSGADLRNADLRNADLRGANLSDADLSGADLRNANLRGADLTQTGLYVP